MNSFLLDTHVLLWAATDSDRLTPPLREALSTASRLAFSAVNLWEIVIKTSLVKGFVADPGLIQRYALAAGYEEISVRSDHAIAVSQLPYHHKDPFDRLLIAQAQVENLQLLTVDSTLAAYGLAVVSL